MNKNLKNLLILPICAGAIALGYTISERKVPEYFHPTQDTTSIDDYLRVIGKRPDYYRETTSGQYLAANFAQRQKDWSNASEYLSKIIDKNEGNDTLEQQAMILAMGSGEVGRSVKLAGKLYDYKNKDDAPKANVMAMLFLVMDAFDKNDLKAASTILKSVPSNSLGSFITPVLKAWVNAGENPDTLDISAVPLNSLYAYHVLLIGKMTGQLDEAIKFADKSLGLTTPEADIDPHDVFKIGDFYASIERPEKARELYALLSKIGYTSPTLEKRLDILNGKNEDGETLKDIVHVPDIQSVKDGAALVFLNMAQILSRDFSDDSALIFSNMALHLAPKNGDADQLIIASKARIILGNTLARHDRFEDATAHYLDISKQSHDFATAQMLAADLYEDQENHTKAIETLENLFAHNQDPEAIIQIGHIERIREDFDAAITQYNKAADIIGEPIPQKHWTLLYARGMAYERIKDFEKSEQDLLKALAYQPNHPYILNYLGYSWADQGINLEQSLDMIARAVALKPGDGYIADSMGWVLYRMGRAKEALPHMERAVQLLPYDPVINDHLGDVYWKNNRFIEARFQWERAFNNLEGHSDEADLKGQLEAKLKHGLDHESVQGDKMIAGEGANDDAQNLAVETHADTHSTPNHN